MLENDRIKLLVERNVARLQQHAQTNVDEAFIEDMTELGVGLLQAFNDIAFYLGEVVERMDKDSGRG